MIARPPPPPGPVLVVGLARSGVAAALALRSLGRAVVGTDARAVEAGDRERLVGAGVTVRDGVEGVDLLQGVRSVVKSPGVPQEAPVVAAARRRGLPVIGELELGWRLLEHEFLAITGSNGKTTTVELVGHIHRAAGVDVVVAGNVGTPLASLPGTLAPGTVVVCEASSFQLEDTEAFAPEAAVLLNLTEDHLDRHGTFAAYRAAKLRAFAHQPPGTLAIIPAALPLPDLGGQATRITFGPALSARDRVDRGDTTGGGPERDGATGRAPDLAERDGALVWRATRLMATSEIRLRGPHNLENAMAAAALCLARGIRPDAVRAGLASFAGVPHRLEEVGRIDGVLYVNDSKATNVAAAEVALRSFARGVHAILGGRGKGSDYAPLAAPVAERCAAVYLIGETAAELREALEPTGVPLHMSGDLERAVASAYDAARGGEVVLLAPACTSYDQYRSYEERGEHFRSLVRRLMS